MAYRIKPTGTIDPTDRHAWALEETCCKSCKLPLERGDYAMTLITERRQVWGLREPVTYTTPHFYHAGCAPKSLTRARGGKRMTK